MEFEFALDYMVYRADRSTVESGRTKKKRRRAEERSTTILNFHLMFVI